MPLAPSSWASLAVGHCSGDRQKSGGRFEIVEHGRQVEPAPADHLEVGEIGLPELVGRGGLVLERIGGLDHDEGRAGDQVACLQQAVD